HRHPQWLFPAPGPAGRGMKTADRPLPRSSLQGALRRALKRSGTAKPASVHTLRHCYDTHLLEAGINLRQIQENMELLPVIRQLLPQPPDPAPATPAPEVGPPPPQDPLNDPSPDPALQPGSDHGGWRQLDQTILARPDAGDGSVAPSSPLHPHPTDDVERPTDDRPLRRCPSCGRPLVALGTLPRLYARPRDPPA
ncbi:MAG: tyrosine-type recombinase/integrase, partial [Candidatus Latescibacterota bacterium]